MVVTLNPNVVMNGCAELVLPFEEDVREVVCQILEGGREVFEKRYRRVMG